MNKWGERKLKVGFFMTSGLFSVIHLHYKWGFSLGFSILLGFGFISILWLGLVWAIKSAFGKQ